MSAAEGAVDRALLDAAADWVIRLRYETPDADTREAFARWLGQSDAHAQAWERAQRVLGHFDLVPAGIGRDVLRSRGRRSVVRALVAGGLLLPAGWMAWRRAPVWTADLRTATGERRDWILDDGTRVVLNTGSAVDVRFTATERRLVLLAGELLLTTGKDAVRPLLVQTPYGDVQALGTRFSVRLNEPGCQVAVFEHAVEIRPRHGQPLRLDAGQAARFTEAGADTPLAANADDTAWEQGMLVVRNQRLTDVVAELGRYRPGVLRCDAEVANLRLTGALSVSDTDSALRVLAARLPVKVRRVSAYWVTVGPQ
ncbi:FecR domain-containing protein [Achromobacter arsenitoxydans]|uniref:Putative FecR n=1 Tax=Achromobacter arsenitoxydans SY8 TaxID=477184 RepID=H0F8Q7_9BURK|nr:FecR domain-containing protein [Achromobacter arsenitoxydans]EHK65371.1 putative FecR [Achromobacter arsenitoxydans SY8]